MTTSVVLNEIAWAEDMIQRRDIGKKPFETLMRVAKYYTYRGVKKCDIRGKMEEFLLSCDPSISLVVWDKRLEDAERAAAKRPPILMDGVVITEPEVACIDSLESRMLQKLAFTLLCLAKYLQRAGISSDGWVSTPDTEVVRMANMSLSVKRRCYLFAQLRDAGLIRFSKRVDNNSVQVLFIRPGPTALVVTDFRNLGLQYFLYKGEKFPVCENCGLVYKTNVKDPRGRPRKYCPDCAAKIRVKQNVESVMRGRKSQNVGK